MENFRGLAVLATNRKKDLDEAFLRRLRYVIEFPLPGEPERLTIWKKAIPHEVEASGVDLEFLAAEYALAGGNIRSIVLNACLQSAARSHEPRLEMETVVRAVAREYEKLGRPLTAQQTERWIPAGSAAMQNGLTRGVR
jgi:SpoVK/Ycf46/Vps4 family AAA+-type ATPase